MDSPFRTHSNQSSTAAIKAIDFHVSSWLPRKTTPHANAVNRELGKQHVQHNAANAESLAPACPLVTLTPTPFASEERFTCMFSPTPVPLIGQHARDAF